MRCGLSSRVMSSGKSLAQGGSGPWGAGDCTTDSVLVDEAAPAPNASLPALWAGAAAAASLSRLDRRGRTCEVELRSRSISPRCCSSSSAAAAGRLVDTKDNERAHAAVVCFPRSSSRARTVSGTGVPKRAPEVSTQEERGQGARGAGAAAHAHLAHPRGSRTPVKQHARHVVERSAQPTQSKQGQGSNASVLMGKGRIARTPP